MISLVPLIAALPLMGFLVLLVAGKRLGNPKAGIVASTFVALSLVASVFTYLGLASRPVHSRVFVDHLFTWFSAGSLHVSAVIYLDPLSMFMVLFVTGVATLIHIYSIGYMNHDERFHTFFLYLNLFVFSMVVLVLAGNFPLTFLGWEGVGACSYWLIAFWFERPSAASAGKKAFIINRVGDFGFLLGAFLLFQATRSLNYEAVLPQAPMIAKGTATAITLLFFLGAVGKSAQLPLFVWLVDAMEGPTPVSALIHAATMVTAGVYIMARLNPILHIAPISSTLIAVVGVTTAFVAAMAATAQDDIKKVLAYSTVSQLGYMFLGIGTGAYVAALFLMVTHAFYKALLFLGAGSVIHASHDEQDIKRMGGLKKLMPVTAVTFIVAWLSIAGLPPFSGFWSKGDVLLAAYEKSPLLWLGGAITAVLTAYYMGREVYLVFYGAPRWKDSMTHQRSAPSESPKVMTVPLVVLAFLSIFGGLLNLPLNAHLSFLAQWLDPVFGSPTGASSTLSKVVLESADGVLALIGIVLAYSLWSKKWEQPALEPAFLKKAWLIDAFYDRAIARPSTELAINFDQVVDPKVIDGGVNAVVAGVGRLSRELRRTQSGYVRNYALGITLGAVVLLGYVLTRAGF